MSIAVFENRLQYGNEAYFVRRVALNLFDQSDSCSQRRQGKVAPRRKIDDLR